MVRGPRRLRVIGRWRPDEVFVKDKARLPKTLGVGPFARNRAKRRRRVESDRLSPVLFFNCAIRPVEHFAVDLRMKSHGHVRDPRQVS